jgi:hypothetical protein
LSDGINIDFSPIERNTDYVGDYANAFRIGRAMARQGPTAGAPNAFAGPAPDPEGEALARLGALRGPARAAAAGRADLFASLAGALAGRPYAERRAILDHMAPDLAAQGVPAEALRAFDPSDEALAGLGATARALAERLQASPVEQPAFPPAG